ncbi:signal recognition particle-docking protein FtsY [Verrucomicrobia bacterium]|nr:signal recognition particle-docking protein FtsY [Verrucomicrobiota bacterium]
MGFFSKLKERLGKTQNKLVHEIKRIVSRSARLTADSAEELEVALLSADFGMSMTTQIIAATKKAYENKGKGDFDFIQVAADEVEKALQKGEHTLLDQGDDLTVVSMVGVNGTGKTTTCAKLAHQLKAKGLSVGMAACDTFRAAAIDQLKVWSERLNVPLTTGDYGADPAAVAHDAVSSALSCKAHYMLIDTAGRLHTKHNLMKELQKVHRVMGKRLENAPHETLLVIDATTGMNALNQAREFNKAVPLTGLVITKLDGTSKAGMVVAIQNELKIPVKFIGVGEQPDDLQPFVAREFARAIFGLEQ